jgi:carbohydrate diacid regulator
MTTPVAPIGERGVCEQRACSPRRRSTTWNDLMGPMTTPARVEFARVAGTITARAAEILHAKVCISDDRGIVVASTDHSLIGQLTSRVEPDEAEAYVRIPLQLDEQAGEVIIAEPVADNREVATRLTQALLDLMLKQAADGGRFPPLHNLKNEFIDDLLHGTDRAPAAILRQANLLGMDLTPPRAVILIDASEYILTSRDPNGRVIDIREEHRRSQQIVASIVRFFQLPTDTICAYIGNGEVAVLKASDSKNLVGWVDRADGDEEESASWANLSALKRAGTALLARLRHDTQMTITVGIGRYHPGIAGLAASYQDARAAISLGERSCGQNRVHCLSELGVAAFVGLSDERIKIDLAQHLLSPLDHAPELLQTLGVFFEEDCCPSSTARQLMVHRNTLSYRLSKVASLTGLDPRRFDDAVQIRLALVLRHLAAPGADDHRSGLAGAA